MRLIRLFACIATSFVLAASATSVSAAPQSHASYVKKVSEGGISPAGLPEKPGKNGWWASGWSKTDGAGFFGRPAMLTETENTDTNIVIRYTEYTTDYDAAFAAPVWGAYTVDTNTVANDLSGDRTASNPDFGRPSQFFQEPLVVTLCTHLGIAAAKHQTFTDCVDPLFCDADFRGLPSKKARADPRIIQRGHMVPNNAMKCAGTYEEGQVAQLESFSVANIVPQMAKCNAPSWSALESACLDWANELGQVWLIVGPVFHDKAHPTYEEKRTSGAKQIVPCPDELFYVVIGKRGGKTSAVGFLMPHTPDYVDFKTKAVPVSKIQDLTGLNFMPDLGEPNAVETNVDDAWLHTPPRKIGEGAND